MRYANNKTTIRNYSYSSFTHLLKLDIWTMDYGRFPKILVENGKKGGKIIIITIIIQI